MMGCPIYTMTTATTTATTATATTATTTAAITTTASTTSYVLSVAQATGMFDSSAALVTAAVLIVARSRTSVTADTKRAAATKTK